MFANEQTSATAAINSTSDGCLKVFIFNTQSCKKGECV